MLSGKIIGDLSDIDRALAALDLVAAT